MNDQFNYKEIAEEQCNRRYHTEMWKDERVQVLKERAELLAENERLRKALLPLCAFGVEDHDYSEDMPEEIDDPQAAWEWRLANSSPDTCLMVEMYQRDILAARKALEQKP